MFFLRLATALAGFAAASAWAVVLAVTRNDRSRVPHEYAGAIRRLTHPLLGLLVETRGEEHLLAAQPCIYVVNHQSAFDVPVLAGLFPPRTVLVAKRELRKIPVFGWLYEVTGNILIDRSSRQSAIQRLREAEDAIRERGVSVWIFPEGTRGTTPGELLPFKKGAFNLAVAAQVPIVPIVVSPLRGLIDIEGRRLRGGTVRVRVLPPIRTGGLGEEDVGSLAARVREEMQDALKMLKSTPQAAAGALQLNGP